MKIFLFIIGSLILAFMAGNAWADDKHRHAPRETISNVSSQALAIATSQIHPELGTNKLQLGVGLGTHKDDTAFAIGIHKQIKLGGKNALVGGTSSFDGNSPAIGVGLNIKF